MLRVLMVDDELPALGELAYLLRHDERVDDVLTTSSGAEALRLLQRERIDAIFSDIKMPGLTGLELARVLARFVQAPSVVFVTAYDDHAVDAFELDVVDYLLKPVRPERLAESVRRIVARIDGSARPRSESPADPRDETISVELGGVTRFVQRRDVLYVEAHGDYARLILADQSHLVRSSLNTLEERWRDAGFVRIHRSLLVSLAHISEVRFESGRCTVRVGGAELQVSRRHTPELRELLIRRGRP
ncbi:MAG TPA: LytTR family DNA-binding domain-containing protein [Actinopolymorphaceae bacterium]